MISEVVDADDVGVVQACGVLGFTPEPGNKRLIAGKLGVQDLYGDAPTKGDVFCSEDVSHAASGEVAGDLVAALKHARFSHGVEWY